MFYFSFISHVRAA